MTKESVLKEIITLRDRLTDVKFRLYDENNSDVQRHLSYSLEEIEITIKEKMILLSSFPN